MSAQLKVELYEDRNGEWSFRVIHGARVILVPGEAYTSRLGARRALRSLADLSKCTPIRCSDLAAACYTELDRTDPFLGKRQAH